MLQEDGVQEDSCGCLLDPPATLHRETGGARQTNNNRGKGCGQGGREGGREMYMLYYYP